MVGDNVDPGISSGKSNKVVGGPENHIPVMLNEVLLALQPAPGKIIVDGTFGGGGYGRAILAKGASLLAMDKDPEVQKTAEAFLQEFGENFHFQSGEFGQMDDHCEAAGFDKVDGVVLDIGVSSMQIDQADRGFSFLRDGPLDMRMGRAGISAGDVVNRVDGKDLTRIIGILGEERHARRVSRAIVSARENKPILRTLELAAIVEKTLGRKFSDKIHPATRTFQALRILVNQELQQLANGLFGAEQILKEGGALVVVTFHSLEDRIVKQFFANRCGAGGGSRHFPQTQETEPQFSQEKRSALKAGEEEISVNPRARSAKLRWAIRTAAAPGSRDFALFGREVALSLPEHFSGRN